ncbi:MAG: glycogen debranching N-terminal domain-containing protein [Actinomycetota bacterium]
MTTTPWTFAGESATSGAGGEVVLVDGSTFFVGRANGDLDGHGPAGLFLLDTRVLDRWELRLDGVAIDPLTVVPNGPFSATFVGRIHRDGLPDASISVVRRRHVGRGMREDVEIRNHGVRRVAMHVTLDVSADFAGLFDVKVGADGSAAPSASELLHGRLWITAADGATVERTVVGFDPEPTAGAMGGPGWMVSLEPGAAWSLCCEVGVVIGDELVQPTHRCGEPVERALPVERMRRWSHALPTVESDDPALVQAVRRAGADLGALRIFDPRHVDRVVVAAGAPWFMTLFGRDSLLTASMALLIDQDVARGVLSSLADAQGAAADAETEEQPGRILHEVRFDRASTRWLGGSNVYYGTVDATPLFVGVVAELLAWTGDRALVRELLPAVDRALDWIDEHGDRDGDGFVEYQRSDPSGLEHQGWKDSFDGIRFADGRLASTPIALCEVQGYVYAAHLARARIADAFGDGPTARDRRRRAAELQRRFDERFWMEHRGCYAVGLDADKEQIDSVTSNVGHCLWTGIVPEGRARRLAAHLAGDSLFSGWGLRTLSTRDGGYNPLSYHCGSVWPHDTAIAVAGLARYGFDDEAGRIARGLLDASTHSGGRLPELFAGFARSDLGVPVPYPASCSPQAWAAAAPLLLTRSMLGLEPDLAAGRLRLRPRLAPGVERLAVTGVQLGAHQLDVRVEGGRVEVDGVPDRVELLVD